MDLFDRAQAQALITRIERLTPGSTPLWGRMTVGQMLAHCSRPFDTIFDPQYAKDHPQPNVVLRTLLGCSSSPSF